jgi:Domain of unknown function (DUF4326)
VPGLLSRKVWELSELGDGTRVIHVGDMSNYPDAVYIGRAMPRYGLADSPFANAYKIGKHGNRQRVLWYYHDDLMKFKHTPSDVLHLLPDLRGKPLACWCRHDGEESTPENRCHGDILVETLARYTDAELVAFAAAHGIGVPT